MVQFHGNATPVTKANIPYSVPVKSFSKYKLSLNVPTFVERCQLLLNYIC